MLFPYLLRGLKKKKNCFPRTSRVGGAAVRLLSEPSARLPRAALWREAQRSKAKAKPGFRGRNEFEPSKKPTKATPSWFQRGLRLQTPLTGRQSPPSRSTFSKLLHGKFPVAKASKRQHCHRVSTPSVPAEASGTRMRCGTGTKDRHSRPTSQNTKYAQAASASFMRRFAIE